MEKRISSRENEKIKYACRLARSAAFRAAEGAFFAEGAKLCADLAKAAEPRMLFYTPAALAKAPALADLPGEGYLIEEHVAEKLAEGVSSQGVFGVFCRRTVPFEALAVPGRLLALERVQDPGNVGALLRSAAAFGFDGALLGPGCADPFGPKALRASAGAAASLPVAAVPHLPDALRALAARGVAVLAAAVYDSRPLDQVPGEWPGGVCLVIGSEGQGLSAEALAAAGAAVRIPMTGAVESLNAAVAGGVLLWHFRGVGR